MLLYSKALKLLVEEDYTGALPLLREAAEKGHAGAQYNLGSLYYLGNGVAKSVEEAVKWIRKAAEAGDPGAQWHLGHFYQTGEVVNKNLEEARRWYQKSADQGDVLGIKFLKEIEAKLQAKKTCPICGYVSESGKLTECPICGSEMK